MPDTGPRELPLHYVLHNPVMLNSVPSGAQRVRVKPGPEKGSLAPGHTRVPASSALRALW